MNPATQTHYRTCHLCEAMCGLEITTEGEKVTRIRGDEQDVYSRGHICPKAIALQDIHTDTDRLRSPMRRTPHGWVPISWEAALEEVVSKLHLTQQRHGRDAVGVYTGNPTVHNTGTILYLYEFFQAIDTRNRFASHSLDQLPQMLVAGEMFGHQAMFPVPDLERTQYFLVLGGNPLVSNGSIMSTPDIAGKIKALQVRGGKLVVVDPIRTRTAEVADTHLFIRPGTDVIFLASLLQVIFAEGLVTLRHLADFTDGLPALREAVAAWTPEMAHSYTGIAADEIRRTAREFAQAESAVCYGRMGVSAQEYGTLCHWLIHCLNIVTGNFDHPGGAMFTTPAIDFLSLLRAEAKALRWKSRVRQLPEVAGDLPTATLADEILTPGPGQIHTLITIAGNPALSAPNSDKLDRALSKLDFMVAIDLYINETTRHAHLILPPAAGLEVMHYDFVLAIVAIRNVANYSGPVLPKGKNTRYDWEILQAIQQGLERQRGHSLLQRGKHTLQRWLTPSRRLDLGLRLGPHGVWGGRFLRAKGLSLRRLRQQPHGVDLGPLVPQLPKRLFTADQRLDLFPHAITRVWNRIQKPLSITPNREQLLLVGRRQVLTNNSWMHNYPRLMKQGDTCIAWMHPLDAKSRGIQEGKPIRVSTHNGYVDLAVHLTDDIMPGTISIPHGWGHSQPGTRLRVARETPGVNINRIIDDQLVEILSGNAIFNGVPVNVTALPEANSFTNHLSFS